MSDGCLSKSGRNKNRYTVRICSNDFDIIEWLHTYMCVGNKIYKQGQNGFVIQFRNECSIKFMMDYGLKERKSLDAVFPDIPDDFLGDFIRGYFDGNGSMVLQRTRYNTYAQVSFTSGSKKFLDALKDRLSQHDIASHLIICELSREAKSKNSFRLYIKETKTKQCCKENTRNSWNT